MFGELLRGVCHKCRKSGRAPYVLSPLGHPSGDTHAEGVPRDWTPPTAKAISPLGGVPASRGVNLLGISIRNPCPHLYPDPCRQRVAGQASPAGQILKQAPLHLFFGLNCSFQVHMAYLLRILILNIILVLKYRVILAQNTVGFAQSSASVQLAC